MCCTHGYKNVGATLLPPLQDSQLSELSPLSLPLSPGLWGIWISVALDITFCQHSSLLPSFPLPDLPLISQCSYRWTLVASWGVTGNKLHILLLCLRLFSVRGCSDLFLGCFSARLKMIGTGDSICNPCHKGWNPSGRAGRKLKVSLPSPSLVKPTRWWAWVFRCCPAWNPGYWMPTDFYIFAKVHYSSSCHYLSFLQ